MNDLVSVIIPVYNLEEYISLCIDSIRNQTYSNIEIILIDDGSQDKSGYICDVYKEADKRIKVFHHTNHGVSYSRKIGVEKSIGQWIIFVDGDDSLVPNAIEFFLNIAKQNKCDIVVGPEVKYRNGVFLRQSHYKVVGKLNQKQFQEALSCGAFGWGVGGKFYARHLFDNDTLAVSDEIKNNEDYIMNMRLSTKMESAYCEAYIGLYLVNIREDSASHLRYPKKNWYVLYDELIKMEKEIRFFPLLFLINSLVLRIHTKELSIADAREYIKKIPPQIDLPIGLKLKIQYIKSGNIIFKFLYKSYGKLRTYILLKKIYK